MDEGELCGGQGHAESRSTKIDVDTRSFPHYDELGSNKIRITFPLVAAVTDGLNDAAKDFVSVSTPIR
jgi:hypothetical protein